MLGDYENQWLLLLYGECPLGLLKIQKVHAISNLIYVKLCFQTPSLSTPYPMQVQVSSTSEVVLMLLHWETRVKEHFATYLLIVTHAYTECTALA